MRLLGTMLPVIVLAGLPATAALAQDAPSAAPSTGTPSATPGSTAPADINQPIGATPQPDINQPIGAGPSGDLNQPIGTSPVVDAAPAEITPDAAALAAPVLADGVAVPAIGASQGYGSPLFGVDSRTNVATQGGSFFGGLPIPALGYSLTVSLVSQYLSNLPRWPSSGVDLPDGVSRSDFGFTPLVSGSANLPFGRSQIYFSGLVGKDYYVRNTEYNRGRFSFAGGTNLAFGANCSANLDANYLEAQSSQLGNAFNFPNTQSTASFGASLGCSPAFGFQPSVSYRYSQARNSSTDPDFDELYRLNDLNNSNIVVTLGYERASLGKVALFGSKSFNRYPNRTLTIDQTTFTSGVNVTNLGGSYERSVGTKIYVKGSLFWVNSVPQDSPLDSSSSLGYSLDINYRPSSRYAFSVNGSSNSSASPNSGALYFTNRSFGGQFTYRINPAFNLGLSAVTSFRDYSGGISAFPDQIKSDRFNNYRAALNWSSPNGHYRASIFIIQQTQNATTNPGNLNPNRFDYDNTMAGISLSYSL